MSVHQLLLKSLLRTALALALLCTPLAGAIAQGTSYVYVQRLKRDQPKKFVFFSASVCHSPGYWVSNADGCLPWVRKSSGRDLPIFDLGNLDVPTARRYYLVPFCGGQLLWVNNKIVYVPQEGQNDQKILECQ